jgi:Flp pilus assembly protein TadG
MSWRRLPCILRARLRTLVPDKSGVALVEFAFVAPLLLLMFLGGYQLTDAITCNRKVTITARAVADLTSQYALISASQVQTLLSASNQIMWPYNASNAMMRVSILNIDGSGNATVGWSQALNGTKRTANTSVTLPSGTGLTNTAVVYGEVQYTYTPAFTYGLLGTTTLTQNVIMMPRLSSTITCSDC